MAMKANTPVSVDAYISTFPKSTQKLLQQIRATIKKAAPDAEETISYQMPAFTYYGPLVYFAGYAHHIGFYPGAAGIANFTKQVAKYKNAKGSVQFPLDKPLPVALITKMVQFRFKQNADKQKSKSLRTCRKGHHYYKSTACPTCPACEKERAPKTGFLSGLSAPARRALENKGIKTLKQLAKLTEAGLLSLHGMGKASLPKLRSELKNAGLHFKSVE
jgi:uncharacterized protein YdhG (YjbR/CyaY superfamily)